MRLQSVVLGSKFCAVASMIWMAVTLSLSAQEMKPISHSSEQSFSGLSLMTPTSLSKTNELGLGNAAPKNESTYQGNYDGIAITVSVASYSADPDKQLDKDIETFMETLSKMSGVTELVHTSRGISMGSATARRVSVNMTRAEKVLRGQFLYVVQGNKIWCVQTIYQNTTTRGDEIASGIIASARLKGSDTVASMR